MCVRGHREEAPHHEWARTRLKELFDTFHIDLPSVILACAPTTKVSGDVSTQPHTWVFGNALTTQPFAVAYVSQATTSVRKGKKLVFFQLKVEAEWMAEAVDYDGNILARVEGELQLPDVDQENYNTDDLVVSGTSHLSLLACLLVCHIMQWTRLYTQNGWVFVANRWR